MDPALRSRFNADFTPDKYAALLRCINEAVRWPADFRISETPIFLTPEFTREAVIAAETIRAQTATPEFVRHAASAIPPGLEVPNESPHPEFVIIDLGICEEDGRLVPRLIELQAFPSLFAFQFMLLGCMRRNFPAIPQDWTSAFSGLHDQEYIELLRQTIISDANPENVILLEIEENRIRDLQCDNQELLEEFRAYTSTDENSNRVGEFAVGTNTACTHVIGNILQDEKIPGIHIAFGHPYSEHTGAKWVSKTHIDCVGRDFDIWFDDDKVMEGGKFLV